MADMPNIILITLDQLRYDCVGFAGVYPVKTPNIDRMAENGVFFTNAFTPFPTCCPARQSLLTSKRAESFGCMWNYDYMHMRGLPEDADTFSRSLSEAGYNSSYIGKWHVNNKNGLIYGYNKHIDETDYFKYINSKYGNIEWKNSWFGEESPIPYEDSAPFWLTERAIEELKSYCAKRAPFHINLNFSEPHLPCRPSAPYSRLYRSGDAVKWKSFDESFENKPYIQKQQLYNWNIEEMTWDDWSKTVAHYYAVITQTDAAIGRLLDTIDEYGLYENTVVIITSDHGDTCGGHRMIDKHYCMYEDIIKVPLIIRYPERVKAKMYNGLVYNCLDLGVTICDMAGARPIQGETAGKSLLPLLLDENADKLREEVMITHNGQQFGLFTQRAVRGKKYKYVFNAADIDELYDLENDEGELRNLIYEKEYADIIAQYRKKLVEIMKAENDSFIETSPWIEETLLKGRIL